MEIAPSLQRALDAEEDVAIVLDRGGVVRFVNAAWHRHAVASGAPHLTPETVLGRPYIDFIDGPLKHVIAGCIAAALDGVAPPGVHVHSECNTPTVMLELTTHFASLGGEGRVEGAVIRQSLRLVGALGESRETLDASPESFRDARGVIVQCGCCRRVREPSRDRWTTCVALIETFATGVSHGLCGTCTELYYSEFLR